MASSLDHQAFGKTRAEWLSNLNTEYKPPRAFRRTSIICTIGMFMESLRPKQTDMMLISSPTRPQDQLS
jgi:hypothetical protein